MVSLNLLNKCSSEIEIFAQKSTLFLPGLKAELRNELVPKNDLQGGALLSHQSCRLYVLLPQLRIPSHHLGCCSLALSSIKNMVSYCLPLFTHPLSEFIGILCFEESFESRNLLKRVPVVRPRSSSCKCELRSNACEISPKLCCYALLELLGAWSHFWDTCKLWFEKKGSPFRGSSKMCFTASSRRRLTLPVLASLQEHIQALAGAFESVLSSTNTLISCVRTNHFLDEHASSIVPWSLLAH